ncbi:MAG: metal-sensing transcriptional repressor [Butyrivibrio sp.]|nr:metal-sensing transcriptional repressor [Butyrivibrio sp.]
MAEKKCCHCHNADENVSDLMSDRHKVRSDKEYKDLINRLSRIEGQIRGIKGMLEKDAYCPDVLTQVAATKCALNSFSKVLLASHIKSCVKEDIKEGNDETLDELVETIQKLMK